MTTDRRRSKRYSINGIKGLLTNSVDVEVVNLSLQGVSIEGPRYMRINNTYYLRLPSDDGSSMLVESEVVWSKMFLKRTEDGKVIPFYRSGLRFKDVLSDKAKRIVEIIKRHRVLTAEERVFGRFEIRAENAELVSSGEFSVEKLSEHGMSIETSHELQRNEVYQIVLSLPTGEVQLKGRIRNIVGKGRGRYSAGVEFVNVDKTGLKRLREFMKQLDSQEDLCYD